MFYTFLIFFPSRGTCTVYLGFTLPCSLLIHSIYLRRLDLIFGICAFNIYTSELNVFRLIVPCPFFPLIAAKLYLPKVNRSSGAAIDMWIKVLALSLCVTCACACACVRVFMCVCVSVSIFDKFLSGQRAGCKY